MIDAPGGDAEAKTGGSNLNSHRTSDVKAWHGLGGDAVVPPRLPWEDKATPTEFPLNSYGCPRDHFPITWPYPGSQVALRWLCTPEYMPSIWLCGGLGWLYRKPDRKST